MGNMWTVHGLQGLSMVYIRTYACIYIWVVVKLIIRHLILRVPKQES